MKIFIIPTSYPDFEFPVKDIFIYEQAKALSELGHSVVILHVKKMSSRKFFFHIDSDISKIDDDFAIRYSKNIKTLIEDRFPLINRDKFVEGMRELYLKAVSEQGKPDVLYAHFSCWAGYAATNISKEYNVPCVTLEHYSGLVKPGMKVPKTIIGGLKETYFGSDVFMCVSAGLKESVKRIIPDAQDIEVVTNMIDSKFTYTPSIENEKFIFLAIGRMSSPKKYDQLIDAFVRAFDEKADVELRIGGDGELRPMIEQRIKKYQREGQIILLGQLTREQTHEQYKKCNCFVLPSGWETFGLVYREAMAVGRPVITTDHGGFDKNTWEEKCGYMVQVNDVDALVDALLNMKKNYFSFDGKAISEFCLSTCEASIVSKKIEKILLRAIEKRKKM